MSAGRNRSAAEQACVRTAIDLIAKDIADLPSTTIAIREKWKEIQRASQPERLHQFDPMTKDLLLHEIAPLLAMAQSFGGSEAAHDFNLVVSRLQTEHLKQSSSFADLKAELLDQVGDLRVNLSRVKAVSPAIAEARTHDFWTGVTVGKLEDAANCAASCSTGKAVQRWCPAAEGHRHREDPSLIERQKHAVKLEGLQLAAYRNRVEKVLRELFETNVTLQRIKQGQPVSQADLEALSSLVLTQDPMLDLHDLVEYYPDCAGKLDMSNTPRRVRIAHRNAPDWLREGAVVYSFKQNKPLRYYEYEIPRGAPGGDRDPRHASTIRHPRLTHAVWHPTGTFILTGHEDGSLVFWDAVKDGRLFMARTLTDTNIDKPSTAYANIGTGHLEAGDKEPLFRIYWCANQDPEDTAILISGGASSTSPAKGLTLLELGRTPNYTDFQLADPITVPGVAEASADAPYTTKHRSC